MIMLLRNKSTIKMIEMIEKPQCKKIEMRSNNTISFRHDEIQQRNSFERVVHPLKQ